MVLSFRSTVYSDRHRPDLSIDIVLVNQVTGRWENSAPEVVRVVLVRDDLDDEATT